MPLLFADLMAAALLKLHLDPSTAIVLVIAIMFGGLINIPVKRVTRTEMIVVHPLAVFGLWSILPGFRRLRRETIIAINLGGRHVRRYRVFVQCCRVSRLAISQSAFPHFQDAAISCGQNNCRDLVSAELLADGPPGDPAVFLGRSKRNGGVPFDVK